MQDDHIVNTPYRTEAMVMAEFREAKEKIQAEQRLQQQMAQGVPRGIRRQMFKTRDPNTRRARKEMARMGRIAKKAGLDL